MLAGCPAGEGSTTSEVAATGSTTGEPATTTGEPPAGLCECFETTSNSFTVTCAFAGHRDCGSYQHCGDFDGGSSSGGEECPSPALEAANAEFVQCTLELLTSGNPGLFGDHRSEYSGQYSYSDHFVANGDGTTAVWSYDVEDLDTNVSAVTHHRTPSATALEACASEATTEEQWRCIETVVGSGTLIETCTEPVSWFYG